MKLMFASDIHGSALWCEKMLGVYEQEKPEKLCLLGDILYHGPRNDLPEGHAPKEVIKLLNTLKNELICVRGNCDTEVDQMVLEFPVLADYALVYADGHEFFLTHGHIHTPQNLPPIPQGAVMINGHTHIPKAEQVSGVHCLNCGSTALQKENTPHSVLIYEDGAFKWLDIAEGGVFMEYMVV